MSMSGFTERTERGARSQTDHSTSGRNAYLIEVEGLRVYFGSRERPIRAVDGVSLRVGVGESVGLVGESGCGKTTMGRAILGLNRVQEGRIRFEGEDVTRLRGARLRRFRQKCQMIFQDPFGSLNPRLSVGGAIEEVLYVHGFGNRRERRERAAELFQDVGLDPKYLDRYPHEFSGGQRQRIGIARALAVNPSFLIADEPVSALDVSVQVQILNLMDKIQKDKGLSYLLIAHDLAVVRYVCRRVFVMYLGKIVETGRSADVYRRPAHPYTEALLASVPDVDKSLSARQRGERSRFVLKGDVPSPASVIPGCPFHPRCPRATERCRVEVPELRKVAPQRWSACHYAEDLLAEGSP